METTKLGHLELIENKERPSFSYACKEYIGGMFADHTGKQTHYLMFTKDEIRKAPVVTVAGIDLKLGRLYPLVENGKLTYIVKAVKDGSECLLKIANHKIKRAVYRACRNPEDRKELSFWEYLKGVIR